MLSNCYLFAYGTLLILFFSLALFIPFNYMINNIESDLLIRDFHTIVTFETLIQAFGLFGVNVKMVNAHESNRLFIWNIII